MCGPFKSNWKSEDSGVRPEYFRREGETLEEQEKRHAAVTARGIDVKTGLRFAPEPGPSMTDKAVQAKRMAQALQLMAGRGRKQSFLGGDYGSDNLGAGSMLGSSP